MPLDTRTLFAVDAITYVALALAVLAVWRQNRDEAGLGELVSGMATLVVGLLLVGVLRERVPDAVSVVGGNSVLVLGLSWCASGVARLHGRSPRRWWPLGAVAATAPALAWLSLVRPDVPARVSLISAIVAVGWLLAARAAATGLRRPRERVPSAMVAAGLAVLGALHGIRAISAIGGQRAESILSGAFLTDVVLAADLPCGIIWVVGVILLVNQRLRDTLASTAHRLAASEERARSLIQNAPDAIVLLDPGTGRFVSHNAAARRLFGCTDEELASLGPADLSPERQPDGSLSRDSARARIRDALAGGTTIFEWTHRRPDGDLVPCEIRLLRLPDAETPLLRGSMVDISERKRVEEERERGRLLLEEAQSLAHVGHWIWERETGRVGASPEMIAILGLPAGREIGLEEITRSVFPEDRGRVAAAREAARDRLEPYQLRYRVRQPGGALRWVDARGRPEPASSGAATRVIEVVQDVTQRVEMEESLRRAEISAALGGLVAGAAHEVRNPLFAISATLDAFAARFGKRPEYEHFIDNLTREVDRLAGLMQRLLEYGKPRPQRLVPGDVARVLERARTECASLAASRRVELEVLVEDDLSALEMDQASLTRAVVNVIQNSLHFAPPSTAVTVEARSRPGDGAPRVELSVRDRGPGFQPEERKRAFEPFYTQRPGGTGLGLSIVQRIVEAHGGRVEAGNHPEGGARVSMSFPALRDGTPP